MSGERPLFRKSALERLSSPEQLDQLMRVTTSRGWLALFALSGLLLAAALWSVFGSIPTRVTSQGILIKSGGLFDVVALGSGQLTAVRVGVGDAVARGQVIAEVAQPELEDQIAKAREKLAELEAQLTRTTEFGSEDVRLKRQTMATRRENLERNIVVAGERETWFEEKLKTQDELAARGLVTQARLLETRQQLEATRQEIERARAELEQLSVEAHQLTVQKSREVEAGRQGVNEARRALVLLEERLELTSRVVAAHAGRVVEVRADVGALVTPGTSVANLELTGEASQELEAILYVPPAEGKSIVPGMRVQVSPSTVKAEEYGHLVAKVKSVAAYPASREGMMRVLANEDLVTTFLSNSGGAPIPVHAVLTRDDNTRSGYRWTSSKGPPRRIHSGTLCTGRITVREQRPLSLVLPVFRESLGV